MKAYIVNKICHVRGKKINGVSIFTRLPLIREKEGHWRIVEKRKGKKYYVRVFHGYDHLYRKVSKDFLILPGHLKSIFFYGDILKRIDPNHYEKELIFNGLKEKGIVIMKQPNRWKHT